MQWKFTSRNCGESLNPRQPGHQSHKTWPSKMVSQSWQLIQGHYEKEDFLGRSITWSFLFANLINSDNKNGRESILILGIEYSPPSIHFPDPLLLSVKSVVMWLVIQFDFYLVFKNCSSDRSYYSTCTRKCIQTILKVVFRTIFPCVEQNIEFTSKSNHSLHESEQQRHYDRFLQLTQRLVQFYPV